MTARKHVLNRAPRISSGSARHALARYGWLLLIALVLVAPLGTGVAHAGQCGTYRTFCSEVLTAPDLNNSFVQAAVHELQVPCLDSLPANTSQMQAVADPYPSGAESLPTSGDGELTRLRYQIQQLHGNSYWYSRPYVARARGTSHG